MQEDLYAINVAKTEFREAFNNSDVERLIAITDPDLVDFSDGRGCGFFDGARESLRKHLNELFSRYRVHMNVIVIEIRVSGDAAYDYGWHEITQTPLAAGESFFIKERYVDIWRKNSKGEWRLWMYMNNRDVPMTIPASATSVEATALR